MVVRRCWTRLPALCKDYLTTQAMFLALTYSYLAITQPITAVNIQGPEVLWFTPISGLLH